jgi:hypothetical protein
MALRDKFLFRYSVLLHLDSARGYVRVASAESSRAPRSIILGNARCVWHLCLLRPSGTRTGPPMRFPRHYGLLREDLGCASYQGIQAE